jgi:lipopolysaccharide biosynthesis regulator YciM
MAGRRSETGSPKRRTVKFPNRIARLNAELAAATDPRDRVSIAADFVRAALAVHPAPNRAERLVGDLVSVGERIYRDGGDGDGRDH